MRAQEKTKQNNDLKIYGIKNWDASDDGGFPIEIMSLGYF